MNGKTELFLDKYKKLEAVVSARYNLSNSDSAVVFLERRAEYRTIKSELAYCREVRNLLTHNPKVGERYAVEPSDEMIALLDKVLERIKNPRKAKHIWVPKSGVLCRTLKDPVRPAMVEMNKRLYAHVPILQDGVVVGAFSENTLLSCLIDDEVVSIDSSVRFSDIGKYLPLDQHRAETFRFVGKETPVSDLADIFAEADRNSQRIGLLFVTATGKPTEKLLGIISAGDVAAVD